MKEEAYLVHVRNYSSGFPGSLIKCTGAKSNLLGEDFMTIFQVSIVFWPVLTVMIILPQGDRAKNCS